ncbi:MAG: hypothetical protein NTZ05_22095 [Chloroflexi bacterium]|nr:hypothetical protein [Chloroflexota bacterium]
MFPIWDVPWWVGSFFSPLQPLFTQMGVWMVWFLVFWAVIIQVGVLLFGAYTINEAIQKSE